MTPFTGRSVSALILLAVAAAAPIDAQVRPTAPATPTTPAARAAALDRDGNTKDARVIWQSLIDSAADPVAKAQFLRGMAISYAFDGDCANSVKYESLVIAYWHGREATDPANAFYQEGEVADEAARACLDAGDLGTAEEWYRKGYAFGIQEPAPITHPRSLWNYRLAHALGRIAARRGDAPAAHAQIAAARKILDGDTAMAAAQEQYFPYLVGYVAFYLNELPTAESNFTKAIALKGNQRDPFMHCLLAMTLEKEGRTAEAHGMYLAALDLATGHNPPAAFVRPLVRKKMGT